MNSSNPIIKPMSESRYYGGIEDYQPATFTGILNKTGLSLAALAAVAALTFMMLPVQYLSAAAIISGLAGIVTVFIVTSKRVLSPTAVGVYAAIEGVFVGAVTKLFEMMYPGIAVQAVFATFVVAAVVWTLYRFSGFRVTPKFRKMVVIGTLSLLGLYLVNLVLVLFGVNTPFLNTGSGAGMISWGISAIAVALASLNLVLDYDDAVTIVENRAPASAELRVAFGLVVTLVWLYVEMLRVLSYFRE